MLRRFDIHRAASIEEAVELRQRYGDEAALYAGGTELLATMKLGVARWPHLIDLKPIPGLRTVSRTNGSVRVGATVTHWDLERDAIIALDLPALARLERNVANIRVRATGTLAGNLAFAEPHADPPALLIALGAHVHLRGETPRVVALESFITGMYQTDLRPHEVIEAIEVPVPADGVRAAYVNFKTLERPTLGVAIVAAMKGGRFDGRPSVVIGAVDEVPRRVPTDAFAGADLRATVTADALAEAARSSVDPVVDLAGSVEYKRHLVGVFAKRALAACMEAA